MCIASQMRLPCVLRFVQGDVNYRIMTCVSFKYQESSIDIQASTPHYRGGVFEDHIMQTLVKTKGVSRAYYNLTIGSEND